MVPSKFNIISKLKDSENYFVLNSLYGSADIIDQATARLFETTIEFYEYSEELEMLKERGYIVDPISEKRAFTSEYLKFLDERETDEIQLFFVPHYVCNFNCSYCYQAEYDSLEIKLSRQIIDSFFSYIDSEFSDRKKYITLFGGEPLLPGENYFELIEYLFTRASQRQIEVAVVTNGYHVELFMPLFLEHSIREVQITLDGTREVHDKRRHLKSGAPSFNKIVEGVDQLLNNGINVNLRFVADRDNIYNLPYLAQFAIDKKWTIKSNFITQIGRNYELHDCAADSSKLFSRIELYSELFILIKQFPYILEFIKPPFSVSRSLFENGELPPPLFDSCPGAKTEWAFDYSGQIYACTATVGKSGEELGRFYPEKELYTEKIEEWSERDILSIDKCRECNLSLLCGGGCASVAKNATGCIVNPDCRPVMQLLELGIATYLDNSPNFGTATSE